MSIVRWDPFRDVVALQDRINRMFDDAFPRSRSAHDENDLCNWRPAVDIYEDEGNVVVNVELPGVRKEDVSVEVKDNILTIKGERFTDQSIDEESYYRRERCFGTFSRSFSLQHHVKPENIKAKFKDGVLQIEVPKPKDEQPRHISVDVD